RALVAQRLFGSMKDLAAVSRTFLQHRRDLAKRVRKDFMQEKHCALRWRERLQEAQESQRQLFLSLQNRPAIWRSEDRLGQPGSNILLAGDARRLQKIQRQAGDDRAEVGFRRGGLLVGARLVA